MCYNYYNMVLFDKCVCSLCLLKKKHVGFIGLETCSFQNHSTYFQKYLHHGICIILYDTSLLSS